MKHTPRFKNVTQKRFLSLNFTPHMEMEENYDTCPKCNTNQKHKNKSVCNSCAKPQWQYTRTAKFYLRDTRGKKK